MQIEIITEEKKFRNLRVDLDKLLSSSFANTIYLTWEWLYTWWDIYWDSVRKLHILVVKDDSGDIKAIAPFIIREKRIANLFTLRVLEFLGTGEDEKDE